MAATEQFNPFIDRLSRDIRNGLSSSLTACLEEGNTNKARTTAEFFLGQQPAPVYEAYIRDRLQRYNQAVEIIYEGSDDPFWRSFVLWDLELFFEMHEVLEHAWYDAEGDTKLIMQALIRAAGVYIKLNCGFIPQAKKMADKALSVLADQEEFLRGYFPPERLLSALKTLDPHPPKLLADVNSSI